VSFGSSSKVQMMFAFFDRVRKGLCLLACFKSKRLTIPAVVCLFVC
jgi:hypothetical protein